MHWPQERAIGLLAAAASGAALAAALASERWGGLVPCALCLIERWPYWAAIPLGLLAAALPPPAGRAALLLLGAVLLGGAALGAVHVGVEQGWWPSPLPQCAAPRLEGGTVAERLARMPALPSKPCDEPAYLVPGLPVSMAAMNLLLALAIGAVVLISAARAYRRGAA